MAEPESDRYAAVFATRRDGRPAYIGEIRDVARVMRGESGTEWRCPHKHTRISLARQCAERKLTLS